MNPCALHWQGRVLTTGSPGTSPLSLLDKYLLPNYIRLLILLSQNFNSGIFKFIFVRICHLRIWAWGRWFEKSIPISWSQRHSSGFSPNSPQGQREHQSCVPVSRRLRLMNPLLTWRVERFCFLSFKGPYKPAGKQLDREGFT